MNIVIVGCGKVGLTLAQQLRQEGHAITLVDTDRESLEAAVKSMDIQGVAGNGTSHRVLVEAGINQADLLIAVTDRDELNMLSCLIGRKAGRCQTIARVRDPSYYEDIRFIKDELGLSMAINPEWQAAQDIFRLLQIPSALDVDTFDKGKVNMIRFRIQEDSPLNGKNMMEVNSMLGGKMLVCIRERGGEIVIPSGTTDLQAGDKVSVVIPMSEIAAVLHRLHLRKKPIHAVTIAGGGSTAVYLAMMLQRTGVQVKIIETDRARCELLADLLPKAHIIHGDCSDKKLLEEEGLPNAEAFVCLTGLDEENILLSLYAKRTSHAKVVTKINRINFSGVLSDIKLDTISYPRLVTADMIIKYARSMNESLNSNVENLYKLEDGHAEALEFYIKEDSAVTNVPLNRLHIRKNILVCSIVRGGQAIIPGGQDELHVGDYVVVVLTHARLNDIKDIIEG